MATKDVTINLHKETKQMDMKPEEDMMQNNTATGFNEFKCKWKSNEYE